MRHYPDLDQLFALKHIIPTSHPSRIEGELRCLQEIGGQDNVMGVELCIRSKDHVVIVMPYFPHEKFQDYILKMHLSEVRDYMKNLLIALRRVHIYALVDFGLAHKAPVTQKGKVTIISDVQDKNSPQLSPSKRTVLSQQNQNNSFHENQTNKTQDGRLRHYTPPTSDFSNRAFTKKVKSPRRLLLAKRALMVKERETTHQRSKSSSAVLQGNSGMATCQCYGQPLVCTICTARSNQQAPRAGTPGFRAPEVLMKCPDQSTEKIAIRIALYCHLVDRYPFFRANDDFTALAQIISIMGSEEVKESAKSYGKNFICSPATPALDLKTLCSKLRQGAPGKSSRSCSREDLELEKENIINASWTRVPNSAYDLLKQLLDLDPFTRITAEKALEHPFFTEKVVLVKSELKTSITNRIINGYIQKDL
ncbi:hypothetical protein KUTeg_021416 [Tegillarca granosa]|uniref:non-specific serine/threonine protein kinase n=1 Tax=Tegillarca granosa TaxID=220873 RepID=A0ABQ9E7P0_TEGGR|nr:hypothetical protein KUTeg_021416 [Tegillarca granosa]